MSVNKTFWNIKNSSVAHNFIPMFKICCSILEDVLKITAKIYTKLQFGKINTIYKVYSVSLKGPTMYQKKSTDKIL